MTRTPKGPRRLDVQSHLKDFGQRLRELREDKSLSQLELAELSGIHNSQLGRIERNLNSPSAGTVLALARALRVSTDTLLLGDEVPQHRLPEIQNLKLFERFMALEEMARDDQNVAITLIDALIAKERVKQAVAG